MSEVTDNPFGLLTAIEQSLHATLDQHQSMESLVTLIQQVYADLSRHQVFKDFVDTACHFTPNEERPVFHQSLAENDQYRLSLIGIHRGFPIPVHDHPHMMGVQFVVHGRLQVRSYQLLETVREPSLVRLECLSENIIGAGSTSTIEKVSCNLHGLQSMNTTAVCIALQAPPCIEHKQAWYFPTHPLADHTQVITWNRVIKSPVKFDAHQNQSPQPEQEGVGS
jgi:hypothetical protein